MHLNGLVFWSRRPVASLAQALNQRDASSWPLALGGLLPLHFPYNTKHDASHSLSSANEMDG